MIKLLASVCLGVILSVQIAQGVTVINADDSGVFTLASTSGGIGAGTSVNHTSTNTAITFNYSFGGFVNVGQAAFAVFDLSAVGGTVTAASLEMSLAVNNTALGNPGTYVFNQVSSDPALLDASYSERSNCFGLPCDPLGVGRDLYFDLSDGAALGSVAYNDVGSQGVGLDATGIDLINLSLGGLFAVGINGAGGNGLGGVTFAAPTLTLEVAAIPLPGAFWLFATAALSLMGLAKRVNGMSNRCPPSYI